MKKAVVCVPIAVLVEGPEDCALAVDEVLCGATVDVLSEPYPNWRKIKTEYGYEGFVRACCLTEDCCNVEDWICSKKCIICKNIAVVVSEPKVKSLCVMTLFQGALVVPLDSTCDDGWQKIQLPNCQVGFVQKCFITSFPLCENRKNIRRSLCDNALTYLGAPYKWSGKTPIGIDCSGLCSQVYLNHGICIYRDAKFVEGFATHKINREQLRPADLIYFEGHIAMYLGNGEYIHAAASEGCVVINSLNKNSPRYRQDLAKGILFCGAVV